MLQYLSKRIARSFLTLLIILTAVFCLLRLMPIEGYFQNFDKMTPQQIEVGLKEMGLSDPLPLQIVHFFKDLIHGDLGISRIYRSNVPVSDILADKVPVSIKLGIWSMIVSLFAGLPMGAFMARYQHRLFDKISTFFIVCIQAVPAAVYFLYIQLYGTQLFHVGLLFEIDDPKYWILPVISMSLGNIAFYGMWLRRYMIDESNKDYVKLAKAKGLSEGKVMFRHIFRNAFVPLVQYIPTAFLNTVIGSIYIESLYSIPGMGGLLVTVIKKHDNAMVQGIVLLYACVGVLGLLLGDLMMVMLDPRISLGRKAGDR
ncbi:ABC transporter permease [Lacrimispora sp.]|jgi:peptide/nickel transport system permease protein/oligopeptide transport system permease protein|uniref:ABC transporter permease n=1 Tax=Lacrimispora sp. TaxID=2719234 RepID=UPI0029E7A8FF|nr:oligopeptide transport system permease protein [Lacrimispora sp.]